MRRAILWYYPTIIVSLNSWEILQIEDWKEVPDGVFSGKAVWPTGLRWWGRPSKLERGHAPHIPEKME